MVVSCSNLWGVRFSICARFRFSNLLLTVNEKTLVPSCSSTCFSINMLNNAGVWAGPLWRTTAKNVFVTKMHMQKCENVFSNARRNSRAAPRFCRAFSLWVSLVVLLADAGRRHARPARQRAMPRGTCKGSCTLNSTYVVMCSVRTVAFCVRSFFTFRRYPPNPSTSTWCSCASQSTR